MSTGLHHNDPEKLLREAAERFSAAPGPEVWAGIKQSIGKKEKRRRYAWVFILPVLLIVGIALVGDPFKAQKNAGRGTANNSNINQPTSNTKQGVSTPPQSPATGNTVEAAIARHNPPVAAPVRRQPMTIVAEKENPAASNNERQYLPDNNNDDAAVSFTRQQRQRHALQKRNSSPVKQNNETDDSRSLAAGNDKLKSDAGNDNESGMPNMEKETKPVVNSLLAETSHSPLSDQPQLKSATPVKKEQQPIAQSLKEEMVKVTAPRRKIRYGLTFSTGAGYRLLQANVSEKKALQSGAFVIGVNRGGNASSVKSLKHQPANVYSAGLTVSFPLSRKWSLETGAEYQSMGYNMLAYRTAGVQLNYTSNGYSVNTVTSDLNSRYVSSPEYAGGNVTGRKTLKNRYEFIKVPVMAVYESNPTAKQSVYVKAGVAGSYLVDRNASYIYSLESGRYFISPNPQTFRNFNIAAIVQPGFLFRLKNNQELHVGPELELNLLPTHSADYTLREYLYNASLKVSYLIRF